MLSSSKKENKTQVKPSGHLVSQVLDTTIQLATDKLTMSVSRHGVQKQIVTPHLNYKLLHLSFFASMAYNYNRSNREWDQGKGYGYDNYEGGISRVRPREDEYNDYGGGEKRRKYEGRVRDLLS